MRTKRLAFISLVVLMVVASIVLVGCGRQVTSEDEIPIGVFLSLTGTTADFGITTRNGIDLALEEINRDGGLLGKKVRAITLDDRSEASEAKTAVTKLVMQNRVVAVLGEVASSRTLAAAPVCQQNMIPLITPASTNPQVTQVGDYVFRVCFVDDFQGAIGAKFAVDNLKLKRAAILRDVKNDYSVGLADAFEQTFKRLGGTIVAQESYSEGDTDFSSQLTSLKRRDPEIIFVPGYYQEVALIARRSRQLGITVPLLGGDGWDSSTLIRNAGNALEGCYFSNHYDAEMGGEKVKHFVDSYKAKYGVNPNALAALGYDAMHILADSINRAGTTDSKPLREAIAGTRDFSGVTGVITIDPDRNALKPGVILQIQGDQFKYVATVRP